MIDRDPLLSGAQDLRHIRVLEVWIDGQQVYSDAPAAQSADSNAEPIGR